MHASIKVRYTLVTERLILQEHSMHGTLGPLLVSQLLLITQESCEENKFAELELLQNNSFLWICEPTILSGNVVSCGNCAQGSKNYYNLHHFLRNFKLSSNHLSLILRPKIRS